MNIDDLKLLRTGLQEFRAEMDGEGAKSIAAAKTPESAARREQVISENLRHVDFVMRWVDAKIRALTPAVEPQKTQANENKNDQ